MYQPKPPPGVETEAEIEHWEGMCRAAKVEYWGDVADMRIAYQRDKERLDIAFRLCREWLSQMYHNLGTDYPYGDNVPISYEDMDEAMEVACQGAINMHD